MATTTTYLVLLRGINVGGRNKVAPLRKLLEELGYRDVSTYIASGSGRRAASAGSSAPSALLERMDTATGQDR